MVVVESGIEYQKRLIFILQTIQLIPISIKIETLSFQLQHVKKWFVLCIPHK